MRCMSASTFPAGTAAEDITTESIALMAHATEKTGKTGKTGLVSPPRRLSHTLYNRRQSSNHACSDPAGRPGALHPGRSR